MEESVESLTNAFAMGVQAKLDDVNKAVEKYILDCGFEGLQLQAINVLRRETDERLRAVWYRVQHLAQEGQRSPRAAAEVASAVAGGK